MWNAETQQFCFHCGKARENSEQRRHDTTAPHSYNKEFVNTERSSSVATITIQPYRHSKPVSLHIVSGLPTSSSRIYRGILQKNVKRFCFQLYSEAISKGRNGQTATSRKTHKGCSHSNRIKGVCTFKNCKVLLNTLLCGGS